jgi:hypothetical protein
MALPRIRASSALIMQNSVGLRGTQKPELVAWEFRNPFGVAFAHGELYITENAFDECGSRPVFGAGDVPWRVKRRIGRSRPVLNPLLSQWLTMEAQTP